MSLMDIPKTLKEIFVMKYPKLDLKFELRSTSIIVKPNTKGSWPSENILLVLCLDVQGFNKPLYTKANLTKSMDDNVTLHYPAQLPQPLERSVGKELSPKDIKWMCILSVGNNIYNPFNIDVQYSRMNRPSFPCYFKCLWRYSEQAFYIAILLLVACGLVSFLTTTYFYMQRWPTFIHW